MTWADRPATRGASRALAGVLAVGSVIPLWFGFWLAVLSFVVSAQRPDPTIADGDPCCGHPDTWGEVAGGLAFGGATVIASAALVYAAVVLGRYAATGGLPAHGAQRRLAIAASLLTAWTLFFLLR